MSGIRNEGEFRIQATFIQNKGNPLLQKKGMKIRIILIDIVFMHI